jgi:hypothetical protein
VRHDHELKADVSTQVETRPPAQRYERILEDMGVDGASVLAISGTREATRQAQVDLIMSFFAPGGDLESAEQV